MNNIIDIKRLVRFIIYENKCSGNISTIIVAGITLLLTVFFYRSLFFATGIDKEFMLSPVFGIENETILLILILSPIPAYRAMLQKEKRVMNIMIPTSNTERYLSLLVNTFITTPAAIVLTALCIDIIASGFSLKYIEKLFEIKGICDCIMITWGGISISTFFLLTMCRYRTWAAIPIIIATLMFESFCVNEILDTAFSNNDYTVLPDFTFTCNLVFVTNIVIFQILIYYSMSKIKA